MANKREAFPKLQYLVWEQEGIGEWYLSPVNSADDAAKGDSKEVEVGVYELKHIVTVTRQIKIRVNKTPKLKAAKP